MKQQRAVVFASHRKAGSNVALIALVCILALAQVNLGAIAQSLDYFFYVYFGNSITNGAEPVE